MADFKGRQIPIEDGNEKPEQVSAEQDEVRAEDNRCSAASGAEGCDQNSEACPQSEGSGVSRAAEEAEAGEGKADEKAGSSDRAGGPEEGTGSEESGPYGTGADESGKGEEAGESGNGTAEEAGSGSAEGQASEQEQESERYMRLMAEFQNFKRRSAREKTDIHAYANEKIIGEILPVLDNFERALGTRYDDIEAYARGMELIFTQLKTALEHAGLEEIAALGEDFDPNVHNAVMTEQSDEHEDGKVSKVLQKGYKLKDKVIRPSMVAVVRN